MIYEYISQNWYYITVFIYSMVILGLLYAVCVQLDKHEKSIEDISKKKMGDLHEEAEVTVDIYDKLNVLEGRLKSHDESTERLILNIGEFNSQQQARLDDVKNVLTDDIQRLKATARAHGETIECIERNQECVEASYYELKNELKKIKVTVTKLVAKNKPKKKKK